MTTFSKLFFLCALICFTHSLIVAQSPNISFNDPNTRWDQLLNSVNPNIEDGQLKIEAEGLNPDDINPEWIVCGQIGISPCMPSTPVDAPNKLFAGGALTATAQLVGSTHSLIIKGVPANLNLNSQTFTVYVKLKRNNSPSAEFREKAYLLILRKPIEMIFVLDRSGSMECSESRNDWEACTDAFSNDTGGTSRWKALKDAMRCFVEKLVAGQDNLVLRQSDKFKAVLFSGVVRPNDVTNFQNIATFSSSLNGLMPTTRPPAPDKPLARDGTSFGAAINKTMNSPSEFSMANSRKILFVMTDGDQNTSPLVVSPYRSLDNGFNMNTRSDIQVFTLGVGAEVVLGDAPTILSGLVINSNNLNDGVAYTTNTTMPNPQLTSNFCDNAFNTIFQNSSPQAINNEKKALGSNSVSTIFPVNKNVTFLAFEAFFEKPIADNYSFKIERNGIDLTSKAQISRQGFFAALYLNIQNIQDTTIKSEGNWTFTAIPRPQSTIQNGSNVYLTATADEHTLKFKCNAGQKFFETCDLITPSVQLTEAGQAISNATVTATIYEPGKDIGDLLARYPAPNIPPVSTSLDAGSCALQKYNALKISNPTLIQSYEKYQPTTINLTHVGNGLYTASGFKTKVTGVYKIIYKADATTTKLGVIQRTEEQTINVRFPSLSYDLVRSKPASSFGDSFYRFTVKVQPSFKDCSGATKYVGPGWEHSFKVTGTGINSQRVTVEDGCDDGKYTISFSTRNRNPVTHISLVDEPVYDGYIRDFDKPYTPQKWEVKLILGGTTPQNSLGTLYKSDFFGKIGLNRRFSYRWAGGVEAGLYRFKDNYSILGATIGTDVIVYGSSNNANPPIELSIGVGSGVFKPQNLNAELGGTGRAMMAIEWWNPRAHFLVEFAYYKLASSGYDFYTGGLGLRYRF
jgi:von Willebrand factor type A domain